MPKALLDTLPVNLISIQAFVNTDVFPVRTWSGALQILRSTSSWSPQNQYICTIEFNDRVDLDRVMSLAGMKEPVWLIVEEPKPRFLFGCFYGMRDFIIGGQKGTWQSSFLFIEYPSWGSLGVVGGTSMWLHDIDYKIDTVFLDTRQVEGRWIWNREGNVFQAEAVLDSDDTAAGFGYFECYIPDALTGTEFELYSWDTATKAFLASPFLSWSGAGTYTSGNLKYLDGATATTKWGAGLGAAAYEPDNSGVEKPVSFGDTAPGVLNYSSRWGTLKRIGFTIKFPADDGLDAVDAGASQVRIRLVGYYTKIKTTYRS